MLAQIYAMKIACDEWVQAGARWGKYIFFVSLLLGSVDAATVEVDAGKTVAHVPNELFGANLLQEKDVPLDDLYVSKIRHLGITLLRYPGGFAERDEFYNWRYSQYNAQAYEQAQAGKLDKKNLDQGDNRRTGIGEFLAVAKRVGAKPTLIVSTLRYVNDLKKGLDEAAAMVRAVNIEKKYGDYFVETWEVGNERYENPGGFADEAKQYIRVMKEVDPRIHIFILAGKRNRPEDGDRMKSVVGSAAYDGLVVHTFVTGDTDKVEPQLLKIRSKWPSTKKLFISAWNSGTPKGEQGLVQAEVMLRIMDGFLHSGVTMAAVWPVQNNTKTSLTQLQGPAIYPAGEIFGWMSEYGKGGDYIQTQSQGVYARSFLQGKRLTVFICGGASEPGSVSIDVRGFGFDEKKITAEAMSARGDTSAMSPPQFRAVQPTVKGTRLDLKINQSSRYEVVRLTLTRP